MANNGSYGSLGRICALGVLAGLTRAAGAGEGFVPVRLPDGKLFETWERPVSFSRTYHVAQGKAEASDKNPGTTDRPWKTIGKAAAVLRPGERVVIHAGVYREWVRPATGGTGPDAMISYEAAPGEEVVIKGSDVWRPTWRKGRYFKLPDGVVTWEAELGAKMFSGANVFCLQNFPAQTDMKTWKLFDSFELRRGQIFVDGVPLVQVGTFEALKEGGGRFWVEDNGMTVHVRLAKDAAPGGQVFEITTREQVFAPTERYLNYIRVKGLRMFHAANGVPIPPPQRGLLSATAGHHWIVEDCEIGYANTLGIDLGGQWWSYGQGELQGCHIIRRNHVHHCGVSAMSAWHNRANEWLLIEDNLVTDNCWMPITHHYESAGIKIHRTEHSVIRRNVILRTINGPSLWLDGEILNTRITQNVLSGARDPGGLGSLFLEINLGPNLVDNNLIAGSGDHGFYEHDAERVVLLQNLIINGSGSGVHLRYGDPNRTKRPYENDHRIFGNIIGGFSRFIVRPNATTRSDRNVFVVKDGQSREAFGDGAGPGKAGRFMDLSAWRELGQDRDSKLAHLTITFDPQKLTLAVKAGAQEALPSFPPLGRPLPNVAPAGELLTHDLMGRARPSDRFQAGPLVNLPLDGTAVSVDPRRK
ncbi:MAG: right-handed parallel beta-helix repeat-containing protein [Phycisphaerae bacterium]|nr:right-handed parallel beta-helix repeat-containing protein [Phycisphaerae bacterium]